MAFLRFAKPSYGQKLYRGFESPPLRQNPSGLRHSDLWRLIGRRLRLRGASRLRSAVSDCFSRTPEGTRMRRRLGAPQFSRFIQVGRSAEVVVIFRAVARAARPAEPRVVSAFPEISANLPSLPPHQPHWMVIFTGFAGWPSTFNCTVTVDAPISTRGSSTFS